MEPYSALFALFGTAPDGIKDYLGTQKISYTSQSGTNDNYVGFVTDSIQGLADGQKAVFIITYWNENGVGQGAHTVAFWVDNNEDLTAYNDSGDLHVNNTNKYFDLLNNLFQKNNPARPISLIYVGRV